MFQSTIEGFGGKRALGFLLKSVTLSKTLQIWYAVLFTCVKQCSACFSPEVCFLFEMLRMRKNTFFQGHSLGTFC